MKNSVKKNYIYNLAYQILVILMPLITTPYVSRVLGVTNLGIYSYTLSIATYFILFGSLGISLYGQREIAYSQGSKDKYSKKFFEILFLRTITMVVSLLMFYVMFVFRKNEYNFYYMILSFELIATIFDISWFFQGLEEFKKTVIRNAIVKLISIMLIFLLVKSKSDLKIYFIIYVLSNVIGNISLWFYLPKYIKKVKISQLNIFKHLKPTIALFIPQVAIQVYTVLDKVMIGTIILDKSEIGYYDQAQKIIKILLTVITSLGTVMLPRIANIHDKGDRESINSYIKKSFSMTLMISLPLLFGLISIADRFVPLFFGNGYTKVSYLMKVISPVLLLIGLSNVIGQQYLLPTKRQKEYTISVIAGALINLVMNLLLIPKLGALGASIGTLVAEFAVTTIQFIVVKENFKIKNIIMENCRYIIASLIMFVVCVLIEKIIPAGNLSTVLIQVFVGGILYTIMLLLLKDTLLWSVVNKLRKVLKI